jgi:hypothetical protein
VTDWGGREAYEWSTIEELTDKLVQRLETLFETETIDLVLRFDDRGIVVYGTVSSERIRSETLGQLASFDRIPKVVDRLEVAAFFHPASDDDWFLDAQPKDGAITKSFPGNVLGSSSDAGDDSPDAGDDIQNYQSEPLAGEGRSRGAGDRSDIDGSVREEAVTRFPTLNTTDELLAGTAITIVADLSTERKGPETPAIAIATLRPGWGSLEIEVTLTSPALDDLLPTRGKIVVFEDGHSTPAVFIAKVREGLTPGSLIEVFAVYSRELRVLATWSTSLGCTVPAASERAETTVPRIVIAPEAPSPTLSVVIRSMGGGMQDWLWFAPPGASAATPRIQGSTGVGDPKGFARKLLAECPEMGPEAFGRKMEKIGEDLWLHAPEDFRKTYLALRSARGDAFPIQVLTDEHSIPWEMMLPMIDGDDQGTPPKHLLFTHPIARWPLELGATKRTTLTDGVIFSFVPEYKGNATLKAARCEGQWLANEHHAINSPATTQAFLRLLTGQTDGKTVGVVHFAGHGRSANSPSVPGARVGGGIAPSENGLQMEDGWVSTGDLSHRATRLGPRDHPVVVLNACELADTSEELGWVEGWAPTLAAREFGAIVAPIWRVQDEAAHDVVVTALDLLLKDRAGIGAAFTAGRAAVSDRSVAAFAFVTYADVMARMPIRS